MKKHIRLLIIIMAAMSGCAVVDERKALVDESFARNQEISDRLNKSIAEAKARGDYAKVYELSKVGYRLWQGHQDFITRIYATDPVLAELQILNRRQSEEGFPVTRDADQEIAEDGVCSM